MAMEDPPVVASGPGDLVPADGAVLTANEQPMN
jgi:hypothetical protein